MARERFMMTLPHDLYEQMEKARGETGRIAFVEQAILQTLMSGQSTTLVAPTRAEADKTFLAMLAAVDRVDPRTKAQTIVQAGLRQSARVARTGGEAIGASKAYRCPSPGCEYSAGSDKVTCPRHGYRLR